MVSPKQVAAPESVAGLADPRAVDILTAEHWSLLSTRSLGYQETFGRATIFVSVLSASVIALALLAQVTNFGRQTLGLAMLLLSVVLFIGLATFVRSVAINYEDARWVSGMKLLRQAYLRLVPDIAPYFVDLDGRSLSYGAPQRLSNLISSLTTTSGVVAALNSVIAGALVAFVAVFLGAAIAVSAILGAALSLVSGALHVRYAARFRYSHVPPGAAQDLSAAKPTALA